jgi:hypothetical protein
MAFARPYHRCAFCFAPDGTKAQGRQARRIGLGSSAGRLVRTVEASRPPRFLENPGAGTLGSRTPAGPNAPGHYSASARPPLVSTTWAPTRKISRLNRQALPARCLRFVDGVAPAHARLASGCWPSSTGRDWLPAGFQRKVSGLLLTFHPPLPGLSWRNDTLYPRGNLLGRGSAIYQATGWLLSLLSRNGLTEKNKFFTLSA